MSKDNIKSSKKQIKQSPSPPSRHELIVEWAPFHLYVSSKSTALMSDLKIIKYIATVTVSRYQHSKRSF
jgi:hypothetical protein